MGKSQQKPKAARAIHTHRKSSHETNRRRIPSTQSCGEFVSCSNIKTTEELIECTMVQET